MTVYELLSFHRELLHRFSDVGIKPDDYRFVELYKEYIEMKRTGEKTTYIVAVLAERHGICERKVYHIIRKLESECKNDAV